MSNQVASLTKQDKSLYVTRGSSLCLYQQQQQQQQQQQEEEEEEKQQQEEWHIVTLVRADPAAERRE